MKSFASHAGRSHAGHRARQIVPALAAPGAVAAAQAAPLLSDDIRLFWTTLAGGLVFFGTYLS